MVNAGFLGSYSANYGYSPAIKQTQAVDIHIVAEIHGTLTYTVCPGSSDPSEKIFSMFASENEVYTIY